MEKTWPEMILDPIGKVVSALSVPSLTPTRDSLESGISRENIKIDIKPYSPHYLVVDGLQVPDWMSGLSDE